MDDLLLKLSNGTRLYSPASLNSITTYVMLEQETWFEKEFAFLAHIIEPGMTAIDIGANLGVYSVAMAKLVGPTGKVFAYEPTSETRARLERTRDANGAENLTIVGKALSDGERTGRIVFAGSSELNHLGDAGDGAGESVEISSLDAEGERLGWGRPDFIKIDAEGEEVSILRGAVRLLADASPLVMLELKAEANHNVGLVEAIEQLGYDTFRLLPGAPILVPLDKDEIDGFQLNFFAAKPDRAAALEARGLLVSAVPAFEPGDGNVAVALEHLRSQSFASAFPELFADGVTVNAQYLRGLAGYDTWLQTNLGPAARYAGLRYALTTLRSLCETDGRVPRLAVLTRVAAEAGRQSWCGYLLDQIVKAAEGGPLPLGEPFWPVATRYDEVPVAGRPAQWFLAAVSELIATTRSFSTAFRAPSNTLGWLCKSGFALPEMHRRLYLSGVWAGRRTNIPAVLLEETPLNLNAALWRDGTVAALAQGRAD